MLAALAPALLVSGCGGQQDALAPKSHQAQDISTLFWWMLVASAIGLALIVGLLLLSWRWRNRRGIGRDTEGDKPGERFAWYVVVGGGMVVPILLVAILFVISDIFVIQTTETPAAGATRMTIEVIGHQWWWEVRYPGTSVVTANEIHIPVRTPVRIEVRTADVIHSFWVPRLNRKIDAIPGMDNAIELDADTPGRYRGQCSEFCGLQHAHMAMYVFADPPAAFHRWLADQAKAATAPGTQQARQGAAVFAASGCGSCHTIRGTDASGDVGPDLTHLASRTTIAALTSPLTPRALGTWIVDNQHVKPGNQMPDERLTSSQLQAVVSYLEGLR